MTDKQSAMATLSRFLISGVCDRSDCVFTCDVHILFATSVSEARIFEYSLNMAEFEILLQDYKPEPSHAADDGSDCITIDVDDLAKTLPDLDEEEELNRVWSAT